ncbi:hypothetical protein [Actinosynnema sp. NPDC023587]|uniref:hypothetical protein n=1 Tax=Actinosynnema sp. NPDC023587 TaxID=3154695 RepID=UPI0033FAC26B
MLWKLMVHTVWETNETWPGWDELMKVTGWGRSSVADYLRQLQVDGWLLLVESGSTPAHRPMAMQGLISGNRRAVYQLRVPAARGQARRRAAAELRRELLDATRVVAEAEAILASAAARIAAENPTAGPAGGPGDGVLAVSDEHAQAVLDGLLLPSGSPQASGVAGKNWTPAFAFQVFPLSELVVLSRARRVVHKLDVDCGLGDGREDATSRRPDSTSALTEPTGPDEALRARFDDKQVAAPEVESPTSGFGMLAAASVVIAAAPELGRMGRRGLRTLLRPYWAAGGSTSAILAALKLDWLERTPVTAAEELAAALRLQTADRVLAKLAVKQLIGLARPYWRAGWTCADLVHALRWYPTTWTSRPGLAADRVVVPGRWVRARLAAWHDEHGRILPGHSAGSTAEQQRRIRLRERYGAQGALAAPTGAAAVTVADVQRRAAGIAEQAARLFRQAVQRCKPTADEPALPTSTTTAAAPTGGIVADQQPAQPAEPRGAMPESVRALLDRLKAEKAAKAEQVAEAARAEAEQAGQERPRRLVLVRNEEPLPQGPLDGANPELAWERARRYSRDHRPLNRL